MDAGRSAFDLDRLEQAEAQYRDAYRWALVRDDAGAVRDAGYDLAVVQLREDKARDARATLATAEGDLRRRGAGVPDEFRLVQAGALIRTGADDAAIEAVRPALRSGDPAVTERAAYLMGVAADSGARVDVLTQAVGLVGGGMSRLVRADAAELGARAALRRGDAAAAYREAGEAVALRRELLAYRDMRRALEVQARAAQALGRGDEAEALLGRVEQSARGFGQGASVR